MEQYEQYKVKVEPGKLEIQSRQPLTSDTIQSILDTSTLQQKAQLTHEKEIDRQHQVYTLLIASILSLGLFAVSFALVRTVNKSLHSEVNYARQLIS